MRAAITLCQLLASGLLACGCGKSCTVTDLHRAAESGDTHQVRSLLANGAEIDAPDQNGDTPLQRAIFAGHTEIATALVDHDAAVDSTDVKGRTAPDCARAAAHADVVRLPETAGRSGSPDG